MNRLRYGLFSKLSSINTKFVFILYVDNLMEFFFVVLILQLLTACQGDLELCGKFSGE